MTNFAQEQQDIKCYSKINYPDDKQCVRFIELPSKGVILTKEGNTMEDISKWQEAEVFSYFYPSKCSDTFAEGISVKLGDKSVDANNGNEICKGENEESKTLLLYYDNADYKDYIEDNYSNAYHWFVFSVGSILTALSSMNIYLIKENKGGYVAAATLNSDSAKVIGLSRKFAVLAATVKELISTKQNAIQNVDIIRNKVNDTITNSCCQHSHCRHVLFQRS